MDTYNYHYHQPLTNEILPNPLILNECDFYFNCIVKPYTNTKAPSPKFLTH